MKARACFYACYITLCGIAVAAFMFMSGCRLNALRPNNHDEELIPPIQQDFLEQKTERPNWPCPYCDGSAPKVSSPTWTHCMEWTDCTKDPGNNFNTGCRSYCTLEIFGLDDGKIEWRKPE